MSASRAWLNGKRALVLGSGAMVANVAGALRIAGAEVSDDAAGATDDFAGNLSRAESRLGGTVELLVHGGVHLAERMSQDTSLEVWRAEVSQDLDGRFLYTAEFARRCIAAKKPGAVLYLLPSRTIAPGRLGSATAVGAIDNLVKSLAVEWARDGIRINAIASRACERQASVSADVCESLGHLAAYLLSDYAAYVTGMMTGIREFP